MSKSQIRKLLKELGATPTMGLPVYPHDHEFDTLAGVLKVWLCDHIEGNGFSVLLEFVEPERARRRGSSASEYGKMKIEFFDENTEEATSRLKSEIAKVMPKDP